MEDEDTYGIVSSLLDSDSSSEEEKQEQQQQQSLKWDATKKIVDLEHQVQEMDTKVTQLQAANKRLKDLVFDVKRNPSQYEGKDITQLLRDIDSNATTSPRSGDSDSINDLVLPFEAGIFAPLSFLSLDPDSDVGRDGPALQKPQQFASSSSSSSSAPASTGLSPVVIPCDSKAQLEQGQHRHQQPRKRSKSFEGRLLSGGITLYDYKGSIVGLSKYQPGCRFIQRQLDTSKDASEEARLVEMVLDEVMPSLAEVLTDTYGQYLVPNIVSHSSSAQRTAIIQALAPKIYELSCSKATAPSPAILLCVFM